MRIHLKWKHYLICIVQRPQDFDKIYFAMQVTPVPIKPTKYSAEPEIYKKKTQNFKSNKKIKLKYSPYTVT